MNTLSFLKIALKPNKMADLPAQQEALLREAARETLLEKGVFNRGELEMHRVERKILLDRYFRRRKLVIFARNFSLLSGR